MIPEGSPMSMTRKIAHKAETARGAATKTACASPATGACRPRAAARRPRGN